MAAKTEAKKTDDRVTITLPPQENPNDANYEFVSVNGKNYKIIKGEPVEVPLAVAEVLANARRAKEEARAYITSNLLNR